MKTKTVVKKVVKKAVVESSENLAQSIDKYGTLQDRIENLTLKHIKDLQDQIEKLTLKHITPLVTQQADIVTELKESLPKGLTQGKVYEAKKTEVITIPLDVEKVFKTVKKADFFDIVKVTKKDAMAVMTQNDMAACEGEPNKPSIRLKIAKIKG